MSLWMEGLTAKIEDQRGAYNKKIAYFAQKAKQEVKKVTRESAIRFSHAAAVAMPPSSGEAVIPAYKGYRKMGVVDVPFRARLSEDKWGDCRAIVYFNPKGGKGKRHFYESVEDARKATVIWGRGSARYGWMQGVRALGGRTRNMTAPGFPSIREKLMTSNGSTVVSERGDDLVIEITNSGEASGEMHLKRSELIGLNKASAAMDHAIKMLERQLEFDFNF